MGEDTPGRCWGRTCQLLGIIPLVVLVLMYWGQTLVLEWESRFGYGEVEDYGLPDTLMDQFRAYDTDASGCIDPMEFSMLRYQLEQVISL